jgi:hypothetical protein
MLMGSPVERLSIMDLSTVRSSRTLRDQEQPSLHWEILSVSKIGTGHLTGRAVQVTGVTVLQEG